MEILGDLENMQAGSEDHTATYFVVNCLMLDVEQHLSSYDNIFGSSPFTKEEIGSLYAIVSLMDSLLRDSSGQSYDRELTNQVLEKRIRDVANIAGDYLDFWVCIILHILLIYSLSLSLQVTDYSNVIP